MRKRKIYRNPDEVMQLWGDFAARPEFIDRADNSYTSRVIREQLEKGAGLTFNSPILELGCGWGRILKQFVDAGYTNVNGLEITQPLVEECFQRVPRARLLVRGDAMHLPFQDNWSQLTYAVRVLQYVDDTVGALREFARVTAPGGSVAVIQPNKWSPARVVKYHTVLLSPRQIAGAFKEVGFQDIEIFYFGFTPRRLYVQAIEHVLEASPGIRRLGAFFGVRGRNVRNGDKQGPDEDVHRYPHLQTLPNRAGTLRM